MNQWNFDIKQYIKRIGLPESILDNFVPNEENLYLITYNQGQNLVYENLTYQLDTQNYKIDPDVVFDRLVVNKRGGLCFDLQELIFAALTHLGYNVQRSLSEVCAQKKPHYQLFTHEVLVVKIENQFYIVDLGFGYNCPRYPLKVRFDQTQEITLLYGETYQLEVTDDLFRVNLKVEKGWIAMFEFLKDKSNGLPLFVNTEQFQQNFQEFLFTKKSQRIRDFLIFIGKSTLHGRIGYISNRIQKTLERVEFMLGSKISQKKYDDPNQFIQDAQKEFQIPLQIELFEELFNTQPYMGEQ